MYHSLPFNVIPKLKSFISKIQTQILTNKKKDSIFYFVYLNILRLLCTIFREDNDNYSGFKLCNR